jgi:DNA-3-methyladenine glycosylase II
MPERHPSIAHLCGIDPRLAEFIGRCPDDRHFRVLASEATVFEALMEAIIYQQLAGKAAKAILEKVKSKFHVPGPDKVTRHGKGLPFPTPQQVVEAPEELLRSGGLSRAKMLAVKDLAAKVLDGTVPDMATLRTMEEEEIIERLTEVRGIGRWTVEMLLIFDIGRLDVLPVDDYGVRQGYTRLYRKRELVKPKVLMKLGEKWKPYRSVAAWYMWRAVEMEPKKKSRVAGRKSQENARAKSSVAGRQSSEKAKASAKAKSKITGTKKKAASAR